MIDLLSPNTLTPQTGIKAVSDYLRFIFQTKPLSIPFNRDIGVDLNKFLFDYNLPDILTKDTITAIIKRELQGINCSFSVDEEMKDRIKVFKVNLLIENQHEVIEL